MRKIKYLFLAVDMTEAQARKNAKFKSQGVPIDLIFIESNAYGRSDTKYWGLKLKETEKARYEKIFKGWTSYERLPDEYEMDIYKPSERKIKL